MPVLAALRRPLARLGRDRSGTALMEFALTLPIVLAMGGWGVELSFLALTNLRVSQIALALADNSSRVGLAGAGGVSQLREADINDVLTGARLQGKPIDLANKARITISSLETVQQSYSDHATDTAAVQRLHWQRCMGVQSGAGYESAYATVATLPITSGTDTAYANRGIDVPLPAGLGTPPVQAPTNSGVMVVEVNYQYKPAFGSMFVSPQIIHYAASFLVRDNRDFSHIANPNPTAAAATCNLHNA